MKKSGDSTKNSETLNGKQKRKSHSLVRKVLIFISLSPKGSYVVCAPLGQHYQLKLNLHVGRYHMLAYSWSSYRPTLS